MELSSEALSTTASARTLGIPDENNAYAATAVPDAASARLVVRNEWRGFAAWEESVLETRGLQSPRRGISRSNMVRYSNAAA